MGELKIAKKCAARTRHFLLSWNAANQDGYLLDVATSEDTVKMAVIDKDSPVLATLKKPTDGLDQHQEIRWREINY